CSKGDKNLITLHSADGGDESAEDMISSLASGAILADANGQQSVIYTTAYAPGQVREIFQTELYRKIFSLVGRGLLLTSVFFMEDFVKSHLTSGWGNF
ncbi:hypothetical protein PoB_000669000, partial [Plakobranchus ocellatus]